MEQSAGGVFNFPEPPGSFPCEKAYHHPERAQRAFAYMDAAR
jgi:hypothetical protein